MFRGGPGTPDSGRFQCENCSLTMLIARAFDLKDYQLSGPDWMESTRFHISAKVDTGATKDQFRLMLEDLLTDRFKLAFHREKKEMPVYELQEVKDGAHLKPSAPPVVTAEAAAPPVGPGIPPPKLDANGFAVLPPGRGPLTIVLGNGHATMRCIDESMTEFARALSDQIRKPVIDVTGLAGHYDIVLNWIAEGPGYVNDDPGGLTIFGALQKQLGLKLQKGRAPVDILVVDHIEKAPSEN